MAVSLNEICIGNRKSGRSHVRDILIQPSNHIVFIIIYILILKRNINKYRQKPATGFVKNQVGTRVGDFFNPTSFPLPRPCIGQDFTDQLDNERLQRHLKSKTATCSDDLPEP